MIPIDHDPTLPLTVDLDRAVLALADAFDLLGVDDIGHAHRVALMAVTLAEDLGWDAAARRRLLRAALLHDCGVSSTRVHRRLRNELEWDGAQAHCETGAACLEGVPPLADLAPLVLEHHSRWTDLQRRGVAGDVAVPANLLYLADRADAVRTRGVAPGRPVVDVLARYAPLHFSPGLFAAFRHLAVRESFWFVQEEPSLREHVAALAAGGERVLLAMPDIKALAAMVCRVIDAKDTCTHLHSAGVARLSRWLGERMGLEPAVLDMLEVAAMLHDLGKLRIPDELLEKTGPLSAEERRMMARHAFDTWEILRRAFGDSPIPRWAACHHEAMSGQGYPFHHEGEELPLEARIVAVADVVQALVQVRPYRAPQGPEEIVHLLNGMVFGGRLDRDVVAVVAADPAAACVAASAE